jgi:hypothetical protein
MSTGRSFRFEQGSSGEKGKRRKGEKEKRRRGERAVGDPLLCPLYSFSPLLFQNEW